MSAARCAAAALLFLVSTLALGGARVQVVDTEPRSPATLGHWEQYYLRVAYDADRPIRVRGEAYSGADRVTEMNSGSPLHPPGSNEALFWFAWTKPARVDRIVVRAEDAQTGQPIAETQLAVELTATGRKTAVQRQQPEWVVKLAAESNRLLKEEFQAHMDRPAPWWALLLFYAAVWSIPIYFGVQIVLLVRWRGGWRVAAGVPAIPMGLAFLHALLAFLAGSNIFPIVLVFTAMPALIYLLILAWLRKRALRCA